MIKIIEYTMLEDDDLPEGRYIEMEEMLIVAKKITFEVIFNTFLEEPNEYLVTAISYNKQLGMDQVVYEAHLKEAYYQKHIGKFTKEAQKKIMEELTGNLVAELDKINWKVIGWDGDA